MVSQKGTLGLLFGVAIGAVASTGANAQTGGQGTQDNTAATASGETGLGVIVVTARRREESLLTVPVSVSALGEQELQRYNANSLETIAELVPGLAVGQNKSASGGNIALRGISTSSTSVGFEQAVLIDVDGVPVSSPRIVAVGFFDLNRVEVLKGPQALLFGKNNTAGVISLVSAGPTAAFEGYARVGYEFVADEIIGEAAISGPLSNSLGARLAIRARHMKGWMYNDARSIANPFAAQFPTQDPDPRLGDSEISGRLTLRYDPSSSFEATLKLFGSHYEDEGFGVNNQVVACGGAQPRIRGVVDPLGECVPDNHTTAGLSHPFILANTPTPDGALGEIDLILASMNATYRAGNFDITSTTGYLYIDSYASGNGDVSSYAQLIGEEPQKTNSFTQEVRLLSSFDGPLNFMVGAFYQDFDFEYEQNIKLLDVIRVGDNFTTWLKNGVTYSKTYSAFGQLIYRPSDMLEIAAGLRYTHETKNSELGHTYSALPGFPAGKILLDDFEDSNLSPEVTVSYNPTPDSTIFAAYRTGYKSGGFALSGTIQTATTSEDLAFDSERARGFEIGAKGRLADNSLLLQATLFHYNYTDLQVTSYDPTTVSFTFSNAARLKQTGFDVSAVYEASDFLLLRGALLYSRNRFGEYIAQCYGGQTMAEGCDVLPGPSQDLSGRPPARGPDWSGNAGVTYTLPLQSAGEFSISGDAFYTDDYFAADTLAPSTLQDAFWRFNAALRYTSDNGRWQAALLGRNLTNKYYLITAQDKSNQAGDMRGSVARGREILIQFGYSF